MAARLYATGACRTKKAASLAAGLHPNYLTMLTSPANGSVPVLRMLNDIDEKIEDQTIETSAIISLLGRKALGKIAHLMNNGSEGTQLKAAIDLADRAPETSKTQKVQLDSFSLSGQDVKDLAAAMVESAKAQSAYADVAIHGLDEIGLTPLKEIPPYASECVADEEAGTDAQDTPALQTQTPEGEGVRIK